MNIPIFKLISKTCTKSPENFSLTDSPAKIPLPSVFVHQAAKNCPTIKISKSQGTQYTSVYYKIWWLYILFEAMNAEKWRRPIFGCKVGQSVPIGMKLELDLWHCLLDVYTKFRIDILKHVEKSPKNPKRVKIIAKIPKIRFFGTKTELMPRSIQRATNVPNLKDLSWFMRPLLQKNKFDRLLDVK